MNWRNIEYLKTGNERQQKVYEIITKLDILNELAKYDATLVSTICIGIDIEESDLDIICQVSDFDEFRIVLRKLFSQYQEFYQWENKEKDYIVCSFHTDDFLFEIFGSTQAVEEQNAYRHLSIMNRLLDLGDRKLRDEVRFLKKLGLKSEPSFAKILNLNGNPFEEMLKIEDYSDDELKVLL